jgi:hypothetical protein
MGSIEERFRRPVVRRKYTGTLARRFAKAKRFGGLLPLPLIAHHEPSDGRKIVDTGRSVKDLPGPT